MSKLDEQKTDDQVVGGGVGQDQIDTLTKPVKGHRVLRYRTPKPKGPRAITPLCRTDLLYVAVQVVKKGSETTLHYHTELDGVWMVLSGRGRFHGNGEIYADLDEREAILLPRGVPYRFECLSDEPLVLLQMEAITKGARDRIVFLEEKKKSSVKFEIFSLDGEILNERPGSVHGPQ